MSPIEAIEAYIQAKDGNQPLLMKRAFADDAELEMVVDTDAISFPSTATGVEAITDILIRRFAIDFENVVTFCLSRPGPANEKHFNCHWLVGMSAKTDGAIRVGCGRYGWHFNSGRVSKLVINIDLMNTFPESDFDAIMNWLSGIPYPWCKSSDAHRGIPALDGLAVIGAYLAAIDVEDRG